MGKRILFLVLLIFIIGCSNPETKKEQQISDTAKIITTEKMIGEEEYQMTNIKYERDDKGYENYFEPMFQPALEWIKENTDEDVMFLNWWDYGHMIRGYTGRDSIIYSPSEDILWSLASGQWDEEAGGEFSTGEEINDVANALTAADVSETFRVMEKYDADYIFVTKRDEASAFIFFRIAGKEDYIDDYKPREKAFDTVLFRMLNKEEIDGLDPVYDDDLVRIYGLE